MEIIVLNKYKANIAEIEKEIVETNKKLLEDYNGNGSVDSIKLFKIVHSASMLDDAYFLNECSGNPSFLKRHANAIIRTMVEQTIEFAYLQQHQSEIDEFFGSEDVIKNLENEIDINNLNSLSIETIIRAYKKFGSERAITKRKKLIEMAQAIGEADINQPTLYNLYRILSEETHNFYYCSALDMAGMIDDNNDPIVALTVVQAGLLKIIMDRYLAAYRKL